MHFDSIDQVLKTWADLPNNHKTQLFFSFERDLQDELFLHLKTSDQYLVLLQTTVIKKRLWLRSIEPDDLVDLIQLFPHEERSEVLDLLDHQTRIEATALLAYQDDVAGGLMNTRYARLRPNMTVEEALRYLRAQGQIETIYYAYILSPEQVLLGVVSLRQLFTAPARDEVSSIMTGGHSVLKIYEGTPEEEIATIFSQRSFLALPVVDNDGCMKGLLTVDDVVNVVQNAATEDIHKIGGQEALDAPYFEINFFSMVRKRAGWLMALFIGEMFTATAMGYYEQEIEKAVVLALFIPLIISSGGNSGSQASTLIIRAMALGEVKIRDWFKVFCRELGTGLSLGIILGTIGLGRVYFWPGRESLYGEHYALIAFAVGSSLIGIVLWGTLAGSMLPFVLRKFRLDPATASAPFVATLVDVTGLMIYFTIANFYLKGTLL